MTREFFIPTFDIFSRRHSSEWTSQTDYHNGKAFVLTRCTVWIPWHISRGFSQEEWRQKNEGKLFWSLNAKTWRRITSWR